MCLPVSKRWLLICDWINQGSDDDDSANISVSFRVVYYFFLNYYFLILAFFSNMAIKSISIIFTLKSMHPIICHLIVMLHSLNGRSCCNWTPWKVLSYGNSRSSFHLLPLWTTCRTNVFPVSASKYHSIVPSSSTSQRKQNTSDSLMLLHEFDWSTIVSNSWM